MSCGRSMLVASSVVCAVLPYRLTAAVNATAFRPVASAEEIEIPEA